MSAIGKPDQAEEWLLAAKPLEPLAVTAEPKLHFLFHRCLANVSARTGHLQQARESFARGMKLAQKLKTNDPNGAKGIKEEYDEFVKAHGA
jgi:hypothetical protein